MPSEPKLEPWMVKWVKREAQSSGSAGRKAREETWSQVAAAIEAALATPEPEAMEVFVPAHWRETLTEHPAWVVGMTMVPDNAEEWVGVVVTPILASKEADDAD